MANNSDARNVVPIVPAEFEDARIRELLVNVETLLAFDANQAQRLQDTFDAEQDARVTENKSNHERKEPEQELRELADWYGSQRVRVLEKQVLEDRIASEIRDASQHLEGYRDYLAKRLDVRAKESDERSFQSTERLMERKERMDGLLEKLKAQSERIETDRTNLRKKQEVARERAIGLDSEHSIVRSANNHESRTLEKKIEKEQKR